ncbi:Protein SPA1-RELATED 3 [Acorus gramineus]|uniref:Protein SPA1-RELATED 3 n=1 Tax=Acorus gramineus TaxID=55184 RepID=A0AAV9BHM7_ACOGR|nr:Protein SPA1-RELATED 3 [Acorus gramineus]
MDSTEGSGISSRDFREGSSGAASEGASDDPPPPPQIGSSAPEALGEIISLREWLDRPERSVDVFECLHIFRQIVDTVNLAHSQGIVVYNVRPSCFALLPFNRVSFVESASCSILGSIEKIEELEAIPLKRILAIELDWYTSPEEAVGASPSFASDIYRLGVLLFEREMIKGSNLHQDPIINLESISEILQSDFLNEPRDNLEDHEAAIELKEQIEEQELLLEFLLQLQHRKQEMANKLHNDISCVSSDIEEVLEQQSILKKKGILHTETDKDENSSLEKADQPSAEPPRVDDSGSSSLRKRSRSGLEMHQEQDAHLEKESLLSKSTRLMKNFKKLEAAYFSTRCRSASLPARSTGRGSRDWTEMSSVNNPGSKGGQYSGKRCGGINPFLEGLCRYLSFSKLKVRADLKQGDLLNSSSLVCSLSFDRDKEFFATAGVNRKIKVFECDMILNEDCDIHYPVVEMSSKSKLSSVCWNSYIKSQIASSDFEGIVQVWDVTRNQAFIEMKEHERRVWSLDFSQMDPTRLASGSDDGTGVSIGTIRTKANVCSVQFPPDSARSLVIGSADHNVYCYDLRNTRMPWCTLVGHTKTVSYVRFVDSSTLISASTDSTLKLWDLSMSTSRVLDTPVQTFTGHTNVKNFVGLSISDGYIATGSETNERSQDVQSVSQTKLITEKSTGQIVIPSLSWICSFLTENSTGQKPGKVFIYHKAFPMPVLSFKFNSSDPASGQDSDNVSQFISSVCWRGGEICEGKVASTGNKGGCLQLMNLDDVNKLV